MIEDKDKDNTIIGELNLDEYDDDKYNNKCAYPFKC